MPEQTEHAHQILDFFEVDETPVVVDRASDTAWVWRQGGWQASASMVEQSYLRGTRISQNNFVQRFAYAALALLETSRPSRLR